MLLKLIRFFSNKTFNFQIHTLLQVAPAELEAILLSHPKVADAGVVGLPDELAGELPVAFVVKKAENVTEKELQDYVARMYRYQYKYQGWVKSVV